MKREKRECSRVESFIDLRRSLCMRPAAENTRSTAAVEAGAARYCLAILASLRKRYSWFFHLARVRVRVRVIGSGCQG